MGVKICQLTIQSLPFSINTPRPRKRSSNFSRTVSI